MFFWKPESRETEQEFYLNDETELLIKDQYNLKEIHHVAVVQVLSCFMINQIYISRHIIR